MGVVVGMNKNAPSSKLGINSVVRPGYSLSSADHQSVLLISIPIAWISEVGIALIFAKPNHTKSPKSIIPIGRLINNFLCAKDQANQLG